MPWFLDHVQLAIPAGQEEFCDPFYVGLLGFTILEKPPILEARGGRWYQRDDALIHLGVDAHFAPATKAHPAIVVDNYETSYDSWRPRASRFALTTPSRGGDAAT